MISKLSNRITQNLLKRNVISDEEIELYDYGLFMMISYCVTTFINHEPILVNDKYDYVLLKSSIDTYSTFSCEYNNKKLQDENVIYSIAIPIDNIKDNAFPIKSDSVIIIK